MLEREAPAPTVKKCSPSSAGTSPTCRSSSRCSRTRRSATPSTSCSGTASRRSRSCATTADSLADLVRLDPRARALRRVFRSQDPRRRRRRRDGAAAPRRRDRRVRGHRLRRSLRRQPGDHRRQPGESRSASSPRRPPRVPRPRPSRRRRVSPSEPRAWHRDVSAAGTRSPSGPEGCPEVGDRPFRHGRGLAPGRARQGHCARLRLWTSRRARSTTSGSPTRRPGR